MLDYQCDICHRACTRNELALSVAITVRLGSNGDPGCPDQADVCDLCAGRPIGDLVAYFWTPAR